MYSTLKFAVHDNKCHVTLLTGGGLWLGNGKQYKPVAAMSLKVLQTHAGSQIT